MLQTESNTTPISQTQTDESQSTSHTRIKVDFTEHGQAIGQNPTKYSTRLGKLTRTHCPPIYEDWHAQDLNSNKIDLWKGIQAEFLVPEEHKKVQLVHANKLWKNWKNNLRKHYDKYSTIAERKRNWPEKMGVKKEDWYVFVDMESTEEARMHREKGKATRKEMNNPHTTGRRGAARTAEILDANNPNEPGTRTDFFMATHTRSDGSFLNEEIGEKMLIIKDILARDPSSKHKDLNHDPVAEVFGKDGRGTVKGYGHGVSKTTLMAAAPYKKKAQEEYMSRLELQRKMDNMERQMDEDRRERREMQEQLNALLTMPWKQSRVAQAILC